MESEEEAGPFFSGGLHQHLVKLSIGPSVPVTAHIRDYFHTLDLNNPDPWLAKSEIPSPDEIMGIDGVDEDSVELLPNQIIGPWKSKDEYLKAHYELLREDAMAPLRDAVAYFRNDPQMMDSRAVSIYEKAYMIGVTFAQKGLAFRIQFSTNRSGRNIVWEYSKRLVTGSIVALSPAQDSFRSKCVIAVVAARPLEGVKSDPPEIDIFFARPQDANFDPHQEWTMVEARTGYFEASRHTMTAIQKLSQERFPLSDHICFLDCNIDAPEYVKKNPIVDIQSAIGEPGQEGKVNILEGWPSSQTGDLDKSQWDALEHILTKRLSIIQGPPGTGKTYVSVVALKVLLSNIQAYDQSPIIIASQTNHALDQLLKHVTLFEKNYIRLGGRSSDPEIKKRTLFAVRQKEPPVSAQGSVFGPSRNKYKNLVCSISELLQAFDQANSNTPLPSSFFAKHGLLTQAQCDSLEKGAKGWIRPGEDEDSDPLVAWLGGQAVKFEVKYTTESFGFAEDEIDLEYEQLKELEAEQGVEEDDYEVLRGQFIYLREGFYGQDTSSFSEAACLEYLRYSDIWKIPVKARGTIYNVLRRRAKRKIMEDFRGLVDLYTRNCKDLQIGKWEWDYLVLQNAKVIGMTTTGLSKYRALVSSVKPKIILIEEAAEAIEAPIAVACLDSIQHMILVGDHQQLKGHCSVQDLEGEPFHLDVSMFERLVNNGIGYVTLKRQRRMASEIRRLLEPIYGELQDHVSVYRRPNVPGMGDVRSFFFSHRWPESSDSLSSKFNEMEAEMIVGYFVYLVLNGVSVKDITILTFYNGQRKKLLKLLRNHSYLQGNYVKVVTVDSYQGEENEIVILSLVRSGNLKSIGFLSVENRVCVALSRARSGFYIFGNAESLASADPLWWQVISIMGNDTLKRRLGFYLQLTCQKHGKKTFIQEPSSWGKTNGGCDQPCQELLGCGHGCPLLCHSFLHDQVKCDQTCNRKMRCGHICKKPCSLSHSCSCQCELSLKITSASELAGEDISSIMCQDGVLGGKDREAIRSYHAFANGGAKQQDALLLKKAKSRDGPTGQRESESLIIFDDFPTDSRKGKNKVSTSLIDDVSEYETDWRYSETRNTTSKAPRPVQQGNLLDD